MPKIVVCILTSVIIIIILVSIAVPMSRVSKETTKAISLPQPAEFGTIALPLMNLTKQWPNNALWHILTDNVGDKFMNILDGNTLKVTYPRGSYIPSSPEQGGFQFYAQPKVFPASQITFSYKVMFPTNFNWVKGGKLPGLWIGNVGANGGNHFRDGASFRVMWRADGAAEAYLYLPKQPNKSFYSQPGYINNDQYGESLWRHQFKFKANVWNTITLVAKINQVGRSDGSISLIINDNAKTFNGIVWTESKSVQYINGLMMHTFFGGNDVTWATPIEQNIYFKDFKVSNLP